MLLRTTGLFFIEPGKSWHEYFRWHTFHFFRYLKVKEVLLRIELFFSQYDYKNRCFVLSIEDLITLVI